MAEVVPSVSVLAVVFAYRSPLTFTEIRPPKPPWYFAFLCVFKTQFFGGLNFNVLAPHLCHASISQDRQHNQTASTILLTCQPDAMRFFGACRCESRPNQALLQFASDHAAGSV